MSKETEKKIQLNSDEVEIVLHKCLDLFQMEVTPYLQCDEYFDRTDGLFEKEDYTVRLRTDNLSSGKIFKIAVKGPRIFFEDNKGYTRIDIEFAAASYAEFQDELTRKELVCVAKLEKQRWKLKKDGVKITIDKYPFIGFFLEVEASEVQRIDEIVNLLNLSSKEAIKKNSSELLEVKLKEIGLPARPNLVATFELEQKFYRNNVILETQ